MSLIPQLLPLEKNSEKRKKDLLTNIIKMLTNRNLLKKENLDENINSFINQNADNDVYKIKLDNTELYYDKNIENMYYVKLLYQKITSISKSSNIGDILYSKRAAPKLIIASGITHKAQQQLHTEFPNIEVFKEADLMIDIVSHISVPKHILLTEEETAICLQDYLLKKREIPKILLSDPISKYFNAKVGQIFRIIRPSELSCESIYYRLVIKGSTSDDRK